MITVNNGILERALTEEEVFVLLAALAKDKKERINLMESANHISNKHFSPEAFDIPVVDSLIKIFAGI